VQIEIRKATTNDIEWLLPQLEKFSKFFGSQISLFGDTENARIGILNQIENHLVLIAEDKDKGSLGFIAGYIVPHPFNADIVTLSETFWWVDEKHRGSRAGLMLLNAFTEWGNEHVDWITFTLEHHSPVNEKTLLKRGYKYTERTYIKEVC
jgi:Acetyltransferase (GNAT) family